jgi:hypothetical protein
MYALIDKTKLKVNLTVIDLSNTDIELTYDFRVMHIVLFHFGVWFAAAGKLST